MKNSLIHIAAYGLDFGKQLTEFKTTLFMLLQTHSGGRVYCYSVKLRIKLRAKVFK